MNSKDSLLLSICIPTRNREKYCIHAIKDILSHNIDNFELVVYDHSDSKEVYSFVETIHDSRLKYFYTTENVSSSENMSRSIQHASGEYVCMIGDDDTILPNIFRWVSYMKDNDIDSLCPRYIPEYFWPDSDNNIDGILTVGVQKKQPLIEIFDPNKRLLSLFRAGIINYQAYKLPRVYHGIISKKCLDNIFNQVGTYFAGLSPDIYSTVALSKMVSKHVVLNEAFTIAGACPSSTTSKGRFKVDYGIFENAPHLKNNKDYKWNKLIPKYYCSQTIWAESALRSARDFNMDFEIKSFNRSLFNVASLYYNFHIREIVLQAYFENIEKERNKVDIAYLELGVYIYRVKDFLKKVYLKLFKVKVHKFKRLSNISQAVSKIKDTGL